MPQTVSNTFSHCIWLHSKLVLTQERDESLVERRQQLRVLNKSGRSIYFAGETSAEHRQRISHDLTVLNERWNAVSASFSIAYSVVQKSKLLLNNQ